MTPSEIMFLVDDLVRLARDVADWTGNFCGTRAQQDLQRLREAKASFEEAYFNLRVKLGDAHDEG